MAGRNGRGRPRLNQNGFTFKPEELKIETYGSRTRALAFITHIPTGITVEGHDPNYPGSVLSAKTAAMKLLSQKVEGHQHETFWDWTQEVSIWARRLAGDSGETVDTPHPTNPQAASYDSS